MMNDKLDADLPAQFVAGARKSSFVITDIVRSDEEPDDADNTLHADQLAASEVTESPRGTQTLDGNFSWVSSPVVADMSLNDTYSRFRIVKIESRDRWHRGRWTCHDFADPPERVKTGQTVENDSTASSVSKNGPSIYYIPSTQDALRSPFGIVYNTGGHPVLEANFLASPKYARGSRFFTGSFLSPDDVTEDRKGSAVTGMDLSSQRTSAADHQEQVGHSAARKLFPSDESNVFVPLEISVSECGRNDVEDTRTVSRQLSNILLTAVDAQRTAGQTSPLDVMMSVTLGPSSSEPDMSGSGSGIDNKIEQAMELLKTHLMFAVREEIEQLKEQISDLTDRNAQLEYENKLLKARASRETLALLSSGLSMDD